MLALTISGFVIGMGATVSNRVDVFFYGLFMDESVLASHDVACELRGKAVAGGYELRIGERATLVPCDGGKAYGLVYSVDAEHLLSLYSGESVADYRREILEVALENNSRASVVCYNLPRAQLSGCNPSYAATLSTLLRRLGFPEGYCQSVDAQAVPTPPS